MSNDSEVPALDGYIGLLEQFRTRRIQLGLTAFDLSARIGMTERYVTKWENGERNPTLYNLFCWATALGLELRVTPTHLGQETRVHRKARSEGPTEIQSLRTRIHSRKNPRSRKSDKDAMPRFHGAYRTLLRSIEP